MKNSGRFKIMKGMTSTVVLVMLLMLHTVGCNGMSDNPGVEGNKADNKAAAAAVNKGAAKMPAFELASAVDGSSVSSDRYRGQVLLVTFFATWCSPCLEEIPSFKELQNNFGPRGFSVVALSMDMDGRSAVKKLVDKMGINYPVLMADSTVARDFGGVLGLPTAFLVDRDGSIVQHYVGFVGHEVLERDISAIMETE